MSLRLKMACLLVLSVWLAVATLHPARAQDASIAAVVNGDVVTQADVENRARFFALATGQRVSPDVLQHLKPQILQQLINERLEIQEAEKRGVVVPDRSVAQAITEIEHSNNMGNVFGGVVPHPFVATKVITHPLVSRDAVAPEGWAYDLGEALAEVVLPGYSVFSFADAKAAGARMLKSGAKLRRANGPAKVPVAQSEHP